MPKYTEQLFEILKKYPFVTWSELRDENDENPPELNLDLILGYHVEALEPEPEIEREYYIVNVPKPSIASDIDNEICQKLPLNAAHIFFTVDGHEISNFESYSVDLMDRWQMESYAPLFEIEKRFGLNVQREQEPERFWADVAYVFKKGWEFVAYITDNKIWVSKEYIRAKELVDLLYYYGSGGAVKIKVNHPKTKQTSLDAFLGK